MTHRPNKRSAAVRRTPNYGGQPSPEKAKRGSRTCWLLGWRASRSSGVSRAKAGGEGSRTPVSCCYVQQRPRMLYQSHFRGEYVLMNERGRRRMLLVLLLPWQAFGNIRNRIIGPLVSVSRTVGSAGSRRKRQTIRRRSRLLKSSNGRRRPSGHLSKSKMFWTGYTKRFPANALFEQHLENI